MESGEFKIKVVVNGQPISMSVRLDTLMQKVVQFALEETGNSGQPKDNWELRDASGQVIRLDKTIGELDVKPDATFYLNLRAGIGGIK